MDSKRVNAFDIISDFESIQFEFERIRNLLQLHHESLDANIRFPQQGGPYTAGLLANRSELIFSQLEAVEILFNCALYKMDEAVNKGYAFARDQKAAAAQK